MFRQAASVLVLGFWSGNVLSLSLLHQWLTTRPPLSASPTLTLTLLLSLLLPLLTRRTFYCAHLCPFGCGQDLMGRIPTPRRVIPPGWHVLLNHLRPFTIIIPVFLLLLGIHPDLSAWEPFLAFALSAAPLTSMVLALLMLLLSLFTKRPWCRYFCPTGQLLNLLRWNTRNTKR